MVHVVPILHPSYILRGNWAYSILQPQQLQIAKQIAETGTYTPIDITSVPENANLYPTLEDLNAFSTTLSSLASVDIECAGDFLVCVGVARLQDEGYVCVRFRVKGGDIYDPDTLCARTEWLFRFLADPEVEKVFHNGQAFDVPYLEEQGFVVRGYTEDTMIQANLTYCELKKGLAFLANAFCSIPNWKGLVRGAEDEKEEL